MYLASRQSISDKHRLDFRQQIALQDGVRAEDWDDVDMAVDSDDGADDSTQSASEVSPIQKSNHSPKEESEDSETELASNASEAEVNSHLTSSSPSPGPPLKKRRLFSQQGNNFFYFPDIILY